MGGDTVKIISMNSVRRATRSWSQDQHSSYLSQLIEGCSPDICFLPGDNGKRLGDNLVIGYSDYCTLEERSVLLYDHQKVTMSRPSVNIDTFGPLPGLDLHKLVTPVVQVYSPKPARAVMKELVMISWQSDLFSNSSTDPVRTLESIVKFAQIFTQTEGKAAFIGGEIPLSYDNVHSVVKSLSNEANTQFLKSVSDFIPPQENLPSINAGRTTFIRHKLKMEVFKCKSNSTLTQESDCFIASKELQLTEAKMLNVEEVLGREVKMETLKKHAPVEMGIKYENRPPRHHGG